MALIAFPCRQEVVIGFAGCGGAVMACAAATGDLVVINPGGGRPHTGVVTGFAAVGRRYMTGGFSGGRGAIVTAHTISGNS